MSNLNESQFKLKPDAILKRPVVDKESLREQISNEIEHELRHSFLKSDFYKKYHPEITSFSFSVGVGYYDEDNEYYMSILYPYDANDDAIEWAYDWQNDEQYRAGVDFIQSLSFDERDFYFAFGNEVLIELN